MNIVFLLRPWPVYGGGETVTIALANEFVNRNHSVHVLYTRLVSSKHTPFINDKIISRLVTGVKADEHHDFSIEDIQHANSFLKEYIKKYHIGIVIDQWWPTQCLKGIKEMCGVIKCHHTNLFPMSSYESTHGYAKKFVFRLLGKKVYNKLKRIQESHRIESFFPYVDKCIFLSESYCTEYINYKKSNKNIQFLDYCNNPLPFDDFISNEEIENKQNWILFVGRMYDSIKKISKMLEIWQQVELSQHFPDWKFILVGEGHDKNNLEKYAQTLNLKQCEFVGYQLPKPYYRKAKIFLMTSTHEGWGMTLVESQQNAVVPIVRDTFSSVHDIITDRENGRIIAADDSQGFTKALMELMANDAERERMGRNGLISCQRFSIKNVTDRWEKIFSEITSDK